jgi:hypothetical protein
MGTRGSRVRTWVFIVPLMTFGLGFSPRLHAGGILESLERGVLSVPPRSQTPDEKKTLASLDVINDHPFYRMTFHGEYPRYLEAKKRFYWAMGLPKPQCSSFAVLNPQGHVILGYNNDGESHTIILLTTDPPGGYASISISAIGDGFPWFTKSHTPFDSDRDRSLLLYAPYDTQCGMNEMGLAVSTMTDLEGNWSPNPGKETVGAAEARRLILDRARDVEEAVALLSQRNVSYQGTSVSHLLLADRSGHSVLLEWVDGEMKVIRNQQSWQVSTNFRVYGSEATISADISHYQAGEMIPNDTAGGRYWRYVVAWEALRRADGLLSPESSMDLLKAISLDFDRGGTRILTNYSVVFDLTTGEVQAVTDRKYHDIYRFRLPMN